jgi:hypothetical protein
MEKPIPEIRWFVRFVITCIQNVYIVIVFIFMQIIHPRIICSYRNKLHVRRHSRVEQMCVRILQRSRTSRRDHFGVAVSA